MTRHGAERRPRAVLARLVCGVTALAVLLLGSLRTDATSRLEWIDVHIPLIAGRDADYAGAVYAAVTAMDEAGIRKSVVMPPLLRANVAAFERLLAHNRKAKIVWAHVGSDPLGHWTVSLSRELLGKHPNLSMSIRMGGGVPRNQLIDAAGEVRPEWLKLLQDLPDRFVIGGDQFFPSPQVGGTSAGLVFARMAPVVRERTRTLLSRLPQDLARKIALENAVRLYRLAE